MASQCDPATSASSTEIKSFPADSGVASLGGAGRFGLLLALDRDLDSPAAANPRRYAERLNRKRAD